MRFNLLNLLVIMKKAASFRKMLKSCELGSRDMGFKRTSPVTKEPLDLCFEKGLITLEQHQYGMRFRWLYSIRFGAIGASSNFPCIYSYKSNNYDAAWLAKKQLEYRFVMDCLKSKSSQKIVQDVCVHNIWPIFLTKPFSLKGRKDYSEFTNALDRLESGFKRFLRKN